MDKVYNKDALKHSFGLPLLKRLSQSISEFYPSFDSKAFLSLSAKLKQLEMKPRIHVIRDQLRRHLPQEYPKALGILLKSLKQGTLSGFDIWPYAEFIQTYGLKDPELSLKALKEVTQVFTSEWAVRPFIKSDPDKTLKFLLQCAQDKNVDVRRWASEGTRPRLPWGERLQDFVRDPNPTFPILEILKTDPELFVRKSVANHLNDISKDHPELVIKLLRRWKEETSTDHSAKIDWIIKRSLRTAIKEGLPAALGLMGVSHKANVEVNYFKIHQKKIKLGERLLFETEIHSTSDQAQKLIVDYIVHFVKSNRSTAPKVFKLKVAQLAARGTLLIQKTHHFKKITTRSYYSGLHAIELQVNGVVLGRCEWTLEVRR